MEQNKKRLEFTKEMKRDYTLLLPNMLPIHFILLKNVFINNGYKKVEVLTNDGQSVVDEGLKYVHNDTCYPALLVIGQMIDALNSGKYDINKVALLITQTGGGCRASNYIHLLRKALVKSGYAQVPVVSMNLSGLEKNSGFKFTLKFAYQCLISLAYGDQLMLLKNQIEPYEINEGDTEKIINKWVNTLTKQFQKYDGLTLSALRKNLNRMVMDFNAIKIEKTDKQKVGIVGEIYVKYSQLGNNNLENFLRSQGCEIMVPGIVGFMLFKTDNRMEDIRLYGGSKIKYIFYQILYKYFTKIETIMLDAIRNDSKFTVPSSYEHLKKLIDGFIGYGVKMGEGWLLTAEILELVEHGYTNIVCAQPFGCLPNHIVGKGMIRKIREYYPQANIVPIDYDPGATKVNQENRIKLMLAVGLEQKAK